MTSEKPLACRRWLSVVAVATIWAALPAVANAADANAGKQLFEEKGCVACHTIGKGVLVGPDLKGVTERRPHEWLEQWIAAPDAVLAKKDPVAVGLLHQFHDVAMPNLGLNPTEIDNILAYLGTAGGAGAAEPSGAAASAAAAPAVKGSPAAGKDLFTGVVRYQNGGPPCMACHSVGGIGALGGGQLGPDLTTAVARYGGEGAVDAFIAGTPTPTMKAVWSGHPLTAEERANVVSFLGQAALTQRPSQAIWQLTGLAVVGLLILLAIASIRWQGRLKFGVRRPMMATPTTGHSGPYSGGWFTGTYAPGWKARFTVSDKDKPRSPTNAPRRR